VNEREVDLLWFEAELSAGQTIDKLMREYLGKRMPKEGQNATANELRSPEETIGAEPNQTSGAGPGGGNGLA